MHSVTQTRGEMQPVLNNFCAASLRTSLCILVFIGAGTVTHKTSPPPPMKTLRDNAFPKMLLEINSGGGF